MKENSENMHNDSKFNLDIFIRFFLRDLQPYLSIRNTVFRAADIHAVYMKCSTGMGSFDGTHLLNNNLNIVKY